MKYICPNCKAVYTSSTPLEFCVCGGKLTPQSPMGAFHDLFRNGHPFSFDMFAKGSKK